MNLIQPHVKGDMVAGRLSWEINKNGIKLELRKRVVAPNINFFSYLSSHNREVIGK